MVLQSSTPPSPTAKSDIPGGAPTVQLNRVTKLYGTVIGVNDVSLSLPHGAYGLLGPNGAGKSTLINLITGQLEPTTGHVRVWGENPWQRGAILDRIGLCPSAEISLPALGARDWIKFLLQLQGRTAAEANERAIHELDQVGIRHAMDRPIATYSKGMRQRAKLAQAMAHDPELLILDEPFNGLDPVGRHDMTKRLHAWTDTGRSVILASHILHEVETVASSFLLILSGRILASGPTAEVRRLLADVPSEVHLTAPRARALGAELVAKELAIGVRVISEEEIVLSVKTGLDLFQALPNICTEGDYRVEKVESADDSLEALFEMLLKIHRGEA